MLRLIPSQSRLKVPLIALGIANGPMLVKHKPLIDHDPTSCEFSQPFSFPPGLPPPFLLPAVPSLDGVEVPDHEPVGTLPMSLNLRDLLGLRFAHNVRFDHLENLVGFRVLGVEPPQTLNRLVNDLQQHGPRGRCIRRRDRAYLRRESCPS